MKELKGLQVVAIIIGGGDGLPYLKKMAKKLGVSDKIKFLGELKYEDLPEYFNTIDICLLPLVEHISMKVRTTGKLPLYLASNRYIISTQTGDAKHYLKENGEIINYSGIKDSSWSKKVASRIKVIYNNKSILEKSKIGSKISKKNFDYAILLRRLKKII